MNGTTEYMTTLEAVGLQFYIIFTIGLALVSGYKILTDKKKIYIITLIIAFGLVLLYPVVYEMVMPYPYY